MVVGKIKECIAMKYESLQRAKGFTDQTEKYTKPCDLESV
mgnify:CR=1 FL=1